MNKQFLQMRNVFGNWVWAVIKRDWLVMTRNINCNELLINISFCVYPWTKYIPEINLGYYYMTFDFTGFHIEFSYDDNGIEDWDKSITWRASLQLCQYSN